jgi:peptidoglycan/xylan/chitin deacetylase (PgdA/CDA1 family)
MKPFKASVLLFFTCCILALQAQQQKICILDLTRKNADSTTGNLFSIEHILKSGGFSYFLTDSVNLAVKSNIVLPTGNIETTTFSQRERDSISSFVSRGGVLIATNIKDPLLYAPFGVSSTLFNTSRFYIRFQTHCDSTLFQLFDDPYEKEIRLGDTSEYATTIGSRAFSLVSGDTLALYETGEVAASHHAFGSGHTYLLGTQYKEVILRPQVKKDYNASRAYSNSFEPAQDVYVFFISGVIRKHLSHAIWKHTAPCNYKAALVITHDVDATTSMQRFDDYANYERINNIQSTYLITTHYVHDKLAKNFFDGYEEDILRVSQMGHDLQTHSVSHVPDFANENRVAMGNPGNNRYNYTPYYDGSVSSNVTVFGEAEASRGLLQDIIGKDITGFRPGYLAFHPNLINVLDSLHFLFSSGHSANDVMTHFPFFSHTDLDMHGRLTHVLEIPNTISDVFAEDPITEGNFPEKVARWETAFQKAYNNNTSTVLLIHPTRYYKLYAEQLLLQWLPQDAVVSNISEYGNYWRNRDEIGINPTSNGDTLIVQLSQLQENVDPLFSMVVQNGKDFAKIKVLDANGAEMDLEKTAWETNNIIIHSPCKRPTYTNYSITEQPQNGNVRVSPNPSTGSNAYLHLELMEESQVDISVFNMAGQAIYHQLEKEKYNLGVYDIPLSGLAAVRGLYIIRVIVGQDTYYLKWVVGIE